MQEKNKVYCSKCDHYSDAGQLCFADANTYLVDNWLQQEVGHHDSPSVVNKNNDCVWFEPRPKIERR